MIRILKQVILLTFKEKLKSYIFPLSGLTAIQNFDTDVVTLATYTESKSMNGQVASINIATLVG